MYQALILLTVLAFTSASPVDRGRGTANNRKRFNNIRIGQVPVSADNSGLGNPTLLGSSGGDIPSNTPPSSTPTSPPTTSSQPSITPPPTTTPTASIGSIFQFLASPASSPSNSQSTFELCLNRGAVPDMAANILSVNWCGTTAGQPSGTPTVVVGGYVGSQVNSTGSSNAGGGAAATNTAAACQTSGNVLVMANGQPCNNPSGGFIGGVGGDGSGGILSLGPGPVVSQPGAVVSQPNGSGGGGGNFFPTPSASAASNENTGIPGSNPKWNNGFGTPPGNGTDFIGSDVCGNGGCKSLQEYCAAVKRNGKHDRECDKVGSGTGSSNGTNAYASSYAYGGGYGPTTNNYGGGTPAPVIPSGTQYGGGTPAPVIPSGTQYGGGTPAPVIPSGTQYGGGSQQTPNNNPVVSQPGANGGGGNNNPAGGGGSSGGGTPVAVIPSGTQNGGGSQQTQNNYPIASQPGGIGGGGIGLNPTGGVQVLGPGGVVQNPSPSATYGASQTGYPYSGSSGSNSTGIIPTNGTNATGVGTTIQVTVTLQNKGCGSTFGSCGFLGNNGSAQAGMSAGYLDIIGGAGQCGSCWRLDHPIQLCGSPPAPCGRDTTSQPIIVMVDSSCAPDNSASRPYAEQCNQQNWSADKFGSQSVMDLCGDSSAAVQTWFGARAQAVQQPGQGVMNVARATRVDCNEWSGSVDRRAPWYQADPRAEVQGLVS